MSLRSFSLRRVFQAGAVVLLCAVAGCVSQSVPGAARHLPCTESSFTGVFFVGPDALITTQRIEGSAEWLVLRGSLSTGETTVVADVRRLVPMWTAFAEAGGTLYATHFDDRWPEGRARALAIDLRTGAKKAVLAECDALLPSASRNGAAVAAIEDETFTVLLLPEGDAAPLRLPGNISHVPFWRAGHGQWLVWSPEGDSVAFHAVVDVGTAGCGAGGEKGVTREGDRVGAQPSITAWGLAVYEPRTRSITVLPCGNLRTVRPFFSYDANGSLLYQVNVSGGRETMQAPETTAVSLNRFSPLTGLHEMVFMIDIASIQADASSGVPYVQPNSDLTRCVAAWYSEGPRKVGSEFTVDNRSDFRLFDVTDGKPHLLAHLGSVKHERPMQFADIAWSADGQLFAVNMGDEIRVYTRDASLVRTYRLHRASASLPAIE